MPRIARIVVPSYPHHVTQRGSRRQTTFFRDGDYRLYLRFLARYSTKARTDIWAYCLMPNHVHLVLVPRDNRGLHVPLAEIHRRYAAVINARETWRGHLWQERFHSFVMEEAHHQRTGRPLGDNAFIEKLEVLTGLELKRQKPGPRRIEDDSGSSGRRIVEGRRR